ncbi:MAG TPA: 16S rRNA (uracil(1498)-N(3))-methyltransferase [Candidatus Limnocylindria bacterium]|nr:16S rRNA (uracil(1498)-N(3))-methyltransferase [Candidatus Limnocylindria bacterium]
MGEPVFYLDTAALVAGERLVLDGPEGRHAADVRRLRVGEVLVVTDGAGRAARAEVLEAARGSLVLGVLDRWSEPDPQPRLVVVQALAKGDRGETAVETLTEVGVDVIVPWAAARSVTRWSADRAPKAVERWRATAREAAKQSRRMRWPEVRDPLTTSELTGLLQRSALGLVLHEGADEPLVSAEVPPAGDVVLVVGPEGGVTPEELATFAAAGARHVRLGATVLRTSTAGTVAAAVVLARTARWS